MTTLRSSRPLCRSVALVGPLATSFALTLAFLTACAAGATGPSAGGANVGSLMITGAPATLNTNDSVQVHAIARDPAGTVLPNASVQWATTDTTIGVVDARGWFRPRNDGRVQIVARAGSVEQRVTVQVIAVFDLANRPMPRFLTAAPIDPAMLRQVSKFRSGFGHDYSDDVEHCRSMKHYFMPRADLDWAKLTVASPVSGLIVGAIPEQTFGVQLQIQPAAMRAATVVLFHVSPVRDLTVGQPVASGQVLGTHIGSQTLSDLAVWITTPTGRRLVSAFDAMDDPTFERFRVHGIPDRQTMVITTAQRDAVPLTCVGEAFQGTDPLDTWILLK